MEWIDLRNLHLLPGPLSSSSNIPQNIGDSWDIEQIPKRPSTITASWTTYLSFFVCFNKIKIRILNILLGFLEGYAKKGGLFLACGMEAGSCMYKWSLIFFWFLAWCLAHSDHQCLFGPQHKWLYQAVLCNGECQKEKSLELSTGPTV